MNEEKNETIDNGEVSIFQKFLHFSQLLDPNLETISLSESKYLTKIYFKESRKLCFSYEYEYKGNGKDKIWIYRNIKIEGGNNTLLRKFYLLELFFTTLMKFDIRTIKIQNFPINKNKMRGYLDGYNKSYQKRIVPQKEVFSPDNNTLQSGIYQIKIIRRNHYIPQGYLREFACENNTEYIYNFKLNEVKLDETSGNIPMKIKNILYHSHFYSLAMELLLKDIEDVFYNIRNKILLENDINWIGDQEKLSIIRYIFAQYLRTPVKRNRYILLADAILRSTYFYQNKQIIDKDELKIEFDELYIRIKIEEGIYQFLDPSREQTQQLKLFDFYLRNRWKLISTEQMKFYTSDNPIILYNDVLKPNVDLDFIDTLKEPNSKKYGTKRPHGLMEPGLQIYFPITPNLCFLIYNQHPSQRFLNPVEINKQILIQCYQNILSSSNRIGNFLKRKLKQNIKEREKFVELHLNVNIEEF